MLPQAPWPSAADATTASSDRDDEEEGNWEWEEGGMDFLEDETLGAYHGSADAAVAAAAGVDLDDDGVVSFHGEGGGKQGAPYHPLSQRQPPLTMMPSTARAPSPPLPF